MLGRRLARYDRHPYRPRVPGSTPEGRRGTGRALTSRARGSTIGTPLDGRNLTRRFQASLERTGLPRMRFHDARHTCATLLLAQGAQPRVVMETLGHSQIGLTLNTYAHVIPELQREAAEHMEDLLTEAGEREPDPVAVNVAVNER